MTDATTKARLQKLLALAQRGVGGEQINAEKALRALLKQHNLTLEYLEDPAPNTKLFLSYGNVRERKLAVQCVGLALNGRQADVYGTRKTPGKVSCLMTAAEAAEAAVLYETYKRALHAALDRAYRAFLIANQLFAKSTGEAPELTPAEAAEWQAAAAMARGVDATPRPRPRVGAGGAA